MIIFQKVSEIQNFVLQKKKQGYRIGFIPTMGALHEGHLSLISRSKAENGLTVASIFINPTQFNDKKDFEKYPRMVELDVQKLESVECDILFLPSVEEMYENKLLDSELIDIGYLDSILEGDKRPGHYKGVITIVEKLFKAVHPDNVYMGLKDYQQVKVVEKLVRDKKIKIKIIGCDTYREANGLAMSSRNMRLTEQGRVLAGCIYSALSYIKSQKNQYSPKEVLHKTIEKYLNIPEITVEYLELRNAYDLSEVPMNLWEEDIRYVALFAGKLEDVRLIDNLEL